jgi:hypothetical protein
VNQQGPALVRLANIPAVRRFVVAAVGGAFFLLGSAYLNLDKPTDLVTLHVSGGDAVRAGLPAAYRVVGRWADERAGTAVSVTDVRVDGVSRLAKTTPGVPALVTVNIPTNAGDEVALAFDVSTEGRRETLHVTAPVHHMNPEPALPEHPPTLPDTRRAHRVSILPQAGVLASGLDNQVFVRVRDLGGRPVADAHVRVAHVSLPDGAAEATTDGSGLMSFRVDTRRPSFRFHVTVTHEGATTELEELFVPIGRQMLLALKPAASRPEQPITARLTTWQADAEVFCDLMQGDVVVWSARLTAAGGKAAVPLGPWPEGRYSLQCSAHPWAFGEAFATAPVIVSESPPLEALLTELRDQQHLHPSGVVSPPGTDVALATAYWQAILRDEPTEPDILLSTRDADLSSREAAHDAEKTRLLVGMALVFLLILAWMTETILKNILETRDRLRVYAAESFLDDSPVEVDGFVAGDRTQRETLVKTRGVLIAVVLLGAIVANVVGLLWFFAIIR